MCKTCLTKTTLVAIFADCIDAYQSCLEVFNRVLDKIYTQPNMMAIGEDLDQLMPVVTIASENEIGRVEIVQQLSRDVIFFAKTVMRNIARMNNDVRLRICRIDVLNAGLKISSSPRVVA